jgi:bifunctional DNA-binding transcriptional regulator/antitoxin component of YhaV-PrlF toxin-antitoxin module
VVMGDRGRLVVPAELRERQQMAPGSPLLMIETSRGVLLVSRDQARQMVRETLAGRDLVGELLAERRRDASADDAEADSADGDVAEGTVG